MRVLFDTNIVLDVLLNRQPWVGDASQLWQAHDEGKLEAYLTATTLTNIFYIARRQTDAQRAYQITYHLAFSVTNPLFEQGQTKQPTFTTAPAGVLPGEDMVFGVGHEPQDVAYCIADPGNVLLRAVGIGWVTHCCTTGIGVGQGNQATARQHRVIADKTPFAVGHRAVDRLA